MEKKLTPENEPMVPTGEVRGPYRCKHKLRKETPGHTAPGQTSLPCQVCQELSQAQYLPTGPKTLVTIENVSAERKQRQVPGIDRQESSSNELSANLVTEANMQNEVKNSQPCCPF